MFELYSAAKRFFWHNQEGATMVEYGLMLALIAAVCITAVTLLGGNANTMFNTLAGSL